LAGSTALRHVPAYKGGENPMKKIMKLGMAICLTAGLSMAAITTQRRGKLIDANCYNKMEMRAGRSTAVSCAPTASTVNFALEQGRKVYMLNSQGNTAAAFAFQRGDLRPGRSGAYRVIVTGSRHGDTINVQIIRGHKSNKFVS
jgi:hypothetical protein